MHARSVRLALVAFLVVVAGCTGGVGPGTDAGTGTVADAGSTTVASPTTNGTLSVHFINVGQGDSTLVVGPTGETLLVDTGDFRDEGEYVLDYLESVGVTRIDYLVSTHADADHVGGNAAVIDHFETDGEGVGGVYDPGVTASTATYDRYLDAVERHDVPLYLTLAGDEVPMEGVSVRVLAPPQPYLAGGERNENSIVLLVRFGSTSVLLPGDAGVDHEEAYLVDEYGSELDVTVLKAGHHGSSTSTGSALLSATTPKAVVVSSAADSRYGHPHEETLRRLAERGVPTYWTATHGTVVATSDGRTVRVATQAAATTEPFGLRSEAAVDPGTMGPVEVRAAYEGSESTEPSTRSGPAVAVTTVHEDAAGDDAENLDDEYVVLTNRGESTVDLSGWTVRDESGATYRIPDGVTLEPGASVTIRTGAGTDSASDLYWDAGRPVWNNDGDTVTVLADDGRLVTEVRY